MKYLVILLALLALPMAGWGGQTQEIIQPHYWDTAYIGIEQSDHVYSDTIFIPECGEVKSTMEYDTLLNTDCQDVITQTEIIRVTWQSWHCPETTVDTVKTDSIFISPTGEWDYDYIIWYSWADPKWVTDSQQVFMGDVKRFYREDE